VLSSCLHLKRWHVTACLHARSLPTLHRSRQRGTRQHAASSVLARASKPVLHQPVLRAASAPVPCPRAASRTWHSNPSQPPSCPRRAAGTRAPTGRRTGRACPDRVATSPTAGPLPADRHCKSRQNRKRTNSQRKHSSILILGAASVRNQRHTIVAGSRPEFCRSTNNDTCHLLVSDFGI
jgi:hypothetical protein